MLAASIAGGVYIWRLAGGANPSISGGPKAAGKGELYAHTAEWLRAQGYEVVRFDLREPSRGQRWNPMAPVLEAMARGRID